MSRSLQGCTAELKDEREERLGTRAHVKLTSYARGAKPNSQIAAANVIVRRVKKRCPKIHSEEKAD